MKGQEYYQVIDQITDLWARLEQLVSGPPVSSDHCKLCLARHGDKMRLLYNGRPLNECSALERVAAVDELDTFYDVFENACSMRIEAAQNARDRLTDWLKRFA